MAEYLQVVKVSKFLLQFKAILYVLVVSRVHSTMSADLYEKML